VGGVRHNEGVLDLTHDAAEERLAAVASLSLAEEGGLREIARRPARRPGPASETQRRAGPGLVPRQPWGGARRRRVQPTDAGAHGFEHDAVEDAGPAKAYPRLGGVDVDVDLARIEIQADRGQRELVPRELRSERLQERLGQERVAHDTAVHDEVHVLAV